MAFVLLIFVFSLGCLSCDGLLQEKGVYLRELKASLAEARRENADLTLEVAALSSPLRIRDIAERELGMVPAQGEDRVYVAAEAEKTTATTAKAESGGGLYAAVTRLWQDALAARR